MNRKSRQIVWFVAGALGLSACVADTTEPEIGQNTQEIRNGDRVTRTDPGANIAIGLRWPSSDNSNRPFCSGVMINNQWVATAAHCVDDEVQQGHRLEIVAADEHGATQPIYRGRVASVYVHQRWSRGLQLSRRKAANDFAMVELEGRARTCPLAGFCDRLPHLGPVNAAIKINGNRQPGAWRVFGYGRTNRQDGDGVLRVDPKMDNRGSRMFNGGRWLKGRWRRGGARPCGGDSGGPWVFEQDGLHIVSGLHHGGRHCTRRRGKSYAMGFTRAKAQIVHWLVAATGGRCVEFQAGRHDYLRCQNTQ